MQNQSCDGKGPDASLLMFEEERPVCQCDSGRVSAAPVASGRPQHRTAH
jgi:hypothetical protein